MLVELETGLVALVKASALAPRLRLVDSLPDLDADSLLGRFTTDAPALYVALGTFPVANGAARPKFGIACVARNSRSHLAARHGDGVTIGLHEMLDAAMALFDRAAISAGLGRSVSFEVASCDMVSSEALYQKGVYVGVIQIQATTEIALQFLDESSLADFKTFHADTDIDPHQSAAEHQKWLQEPPDHSTSAPELSYTLVLQE